MVNFKKEARYLIIMPLALVLIGLLAALVLPNFIRPSDVHYRPAKAQIEMLSTALESYKQDVGVYPSTEQGLRALVGKPDGVANWDGPYLRKDVPNDPWNHPYIYKFPGKTPGKPEIVSYGADGKPGGEGKNADIVSE